VALLAGPDVVRPRARAMLAQAGRSPGYIANLGHGIHKDTPIASVEALVEEVTTWKA
jgi:uroporphyrinogen decarboxylase